MRFLKVEGAGNDYLLVDAFSERVADAPALSRAMSDRHAGVGSDGLILVGPPREGGAARMTMFNADGSEGRMCGNGLRCVIRWLVETGRGEGLVEVETAAGLRRGRMLERERAEAEMGVPDFRPGSVPVALPGDGSSPPELPLPAGLQADPDRGFCVSVGNPHVVVRVREPAALDLAREGAAVAASEALPEGANVHFLRVEDEGTLLVRPFERGSGATRACGTGAVASVAVAQRLGWIPRGRTCVRMPGGELHVRWDGSGPAWLEGPARFVFRGEWDTA